MATVDLYPLIQNTYKLYTYTINASKYPIFVLDADCDFNINDSYRFSNTNLFYVNFTALNLNMASMNTDDKAVAYGINDTNTPIKITLRNNSSYISIERDSVNLGQTNFGPIRYAYFGGMFYSVFIHFKNGAYVSAAINSAFSAGDKDHVPINGTGYDKGYVSKPYGNVLIKAPNYIASEYKAEAARKLAADLIDQSDSYDPDDPDANTKTSGGAGGGGSGNPGGDTNEDDGVPSLSAVDCGLLTIFNPNNGQLKQLGRFLWSDGFNLDSFKKLFNDPFDSIFGLSIIPIQPETQGAQNVFFGNIDTGVSMPVVKSQWVSVDMGTIDLSEIYNSALDYEPTTAVSIYLPYIGMRQLNTVDVMASSMHLIYKFDVLTGSVVAQLYVNHSARNNNSGDFSRWTKNQGFLYSYAGQCAVSIPLSSQSFTNIIQAAISSVGIAAGAAATMASGNPALGVAALSVGTANIGIQSSGSVVQRSGHLSGSQALLDYQTPMLIVIRPHRAKPSKYYNYRGVPSQTTVKLSECSGYTQIADGVGVSASGATDAELNEITSLLRSGVIF